MLSFLLKLAFSYQCSKKLSKDRKICTLSLFKNRQETNK